MFVRRKELVSALKVILGVAKGGLMPICECCKVEFSRDGIVLSATDLETSVKICVPSTISKNEKGSIVLNAKLLAAIVGDKADDEVEIHLKGGKVFIGRAKINASEDSDNFPEIPSPPKHGASIYELEASFPNAVKFVIPAMSKEASRYALCGVLLDFRRGRVVASDGMRLHTAAIGKPANITPVILNPKIFKVIAPEKVVVPEPEKISGSNEKRIARVYLAFPNGIAVVRTIDGKFPEYANLIPKKSPSRFETVRMEFLKCLKKVQRFVSADYDTCKITADGSLIISAKSVEKGVEITEEVPGKLNGKKQTIGINPRFVSDSLAGMKSERVNIYLRNKNSPMLMESVSDKGSYYALIMPLSDNE